MTPDEANALRLELATALAERDAFKAQVAHLTELVEHMNRQLEALLRRLGPAPTPTAPSQESSAPAPASPTAVAPTPALPPKKRSRKTPHGRSKLPPGLPRDERVVRPERCPECGGEVLREIGEEIREQLDYVPARLQVRRTVRKTCACKACNALVTAAAPGSPVDKGLFTAGFLAWLSWSKYGLHLPLERLKGELRRLGVKIEVSTLSDQIAAVSELMAPLVRRLKAELVAGRQVRTDGTGLLVLQSGGGKAHLGQMAIYCSPTIAVYHYTPTKEGKHARAFLDGYAGYLVADASSTFDQLYVDGRIVEVGCWAHAKRKFDDALESQPRGANEALAFVSELYDVEHRARERGVEGKADHLEMRRSESSAILERFKAWLDEQASTALPKSTFGQASRYCLRHWTALTRFVEDVALPLDNNLSERLLRAVAVGRANYVFAGSSAGAERAANIYSMIQTCKLLDVDPLAWLTHVLERIATWPINRVDELLPTHWRDQAAKQAPAE